MVIQRTIPMSLEKSALVREIVLEFTRYQNAISTICFNAGKPFRALELHKAVYYAIPTTLGSQMKCSAIRATAASYASMKVTGKPATKPAQFRKPSALFLSKRDFTFKKDGTLSIATLAGRQKIGWRIPEHFVHDFESATSVDSLNISSNGAHLCITLEVTDPAGTIPVGIDLGIDNAVVASTATDTLCISGKGLAIRNTRLRKTKSRLQSRLSGKKAQQRDTRSIRRVLKRLSRKHHNRSQTFCRETAAKLCNWVPPNAVLVFEDFSFKPRSKTEHIRKGTRRKLNQWWFRMMTVAVQNRAERQGLALAYVDPSYTSQIHNICGLMGVRSGHRFYCPACDCTEHADTNASKNIRSRFTVLRHSGPLSIGPEARTFGTGKFYAEALNS